MLVVGISVLDYVHRMEALPSGGAKFRSQAFDRIGGGCAANAAVGAVRLGGDITLMSRLGADRAGDELADMLSGAGLTLACPRGGRQPLSSIMIDATGERMIVNYPGDGLPEAAPPLPPFDAVLTDCRWPEAAEAALTTARAKGLPSVIDGERFVQPDLAALASHVVFSVTGICDFAGLTDPDAALAQTAGRLPGRVAYTDGPRGVIWADGPTVPAPEIQPVDTLGAGDLWHGAFTLALARGVSLEPASVFANRAAAQKCTRAGGWDVYPRAEEIA